MARYTIRNKTAGRIHIPQPVNRFVERSHVLTVDAPAHLMEQFDYRARHYPLAALINSGAIDVQADADPSPDVIQVPTLNQLNRGVFSTASSFIFGQRVYTGADVPSGVNLPGGGFFNFTEVGLVFYDADPSLQNCRVFLNGQLLINGTVASPNDVRLGTNPANGDLIFTDPSISIFSGDVIVVEANPLARAV